MGYHHFLENQEIKRDLNQVIAPALSEDSQVEDSTCTIWTRKGEESQTFSYDTWIEECLAELITLAESNEYDELNLFYPDLMNNGISISVTKGNDFYHLKMQVSDPEGLTHVIVDNEWMEFRDSETLKYLIEIVNKIINKTETFLVDPETDTEENKMFTMAVFYVRSKLLDASFSDNTMDIDENIRVGFETIGDTCDIKVFTKDGVRVYNYVKYNDITTYTAIAEYICQEIFSEDDYDQEASLKSFALDYLKSEDFQKSEQRGELSDLLIEKEFELEPASETEDLEFVKEVENPEGKQYIYRSKVTGKLEILSYLLDLDDTTNKSEETMNNEINLLADSDPRIVALIKSRYPEMSDQDVLETIEAINSLNKAEEAIPEEKPAEEPEEKKEEATPVEEPKAEPETVAEESVNEDTEAPEPEPVEDTPKAEEPVVEETTKSEEPEVDEREEEILKSLDEKDKKIYHLIKSQANVKLADDVLKLLQQVKELATEANETTPQETTQELPKHTTMRKSRLQRTWKAFGILMPDSLENNTDIAAAKRGAERLEKCLKRQNKHSQEELDNIIMKALKQKYPTNYEDIGFKQAEKAKDTFLSQIIADAKKESDETLFVSGNNPKLEIVPEPEVPVEALTKHEKYDFSRDDIDSPIEVSGLEIIQSQKEIDYEQACKEGIVFPKYEVENKTHDYNKVLEFGDKYNGSNK